MKKQNVLHILILLLLSVFYCNGQDIINPYIMREIGYQDNIQFDLTPKEPISHFKFETIIPQVTNSGMYTGELMVSIKDHHWFANSGVTNYAKSYSVETVSYPFTMNCFDNPFTGCAYSSANPPLPGISKT